jgi:biopolymer transport protein ExbD
VKKENKNFSGFIKRDFSLRCRGFILILMFCSLPGIIETAAQTKREPPNKGVMPPPKARPTPQPTQTPSKPVEVLGDPSITQPSKYAFVIEIDQNEKISVKVENINGSPFGDDSSVSSLSDFFTRMGNQDPGKILAIEGEGLPMIMEMGEKKPTSKKTLPAKKQVEQQLSFADIIIKAHPDISFVSIIKVADAARKSTLQVKIKTSGREGAPFLYIPRMVLVDPNYSPIIRPNPLTLVVELSADGSIWLNKEKEGSINDLSPLKNRLKAVFKEREANGVFRSGTNEVETSVFIEVPLTANFRQVAKIAEALQEAGATSIVLNIDESPQTVRKTLIQGLDEGPKKP